METTQYRLMQAMNGDIKTKNGGDTLSYEAFLNWGRFMTKGTQGKTASQIKKELSDAGYDTSKVDEYFRRMG